MIRLPYVRRICLLCLAALCALAAASADDPYEHPYPAALQIRVETETRPTARFGDVPVDLPVTGLESVNQSLRAASDSLFEAMQACEGTRIDMLATYRVSGTKWAGFLLTARAVTVAKGENEAITVEATDAMAYSVQTYDMETGSTLTLADVFDSQSAAWAWIEAAARELLYSYYPDEPRDETALEAMVTADALRESAFLPCAGQLLVPFPLEVILPDHPQIAYLRLPYPDTRQWMRPVAVLQTDNSSRPMIALTMDDGPTRVITEQILTGLARYGASATFFCVGNSVIRQPDLVRREMDFGLSVAAHSMTHKSPWEQSLEDMRAEVDTQKELYRAVTGLPVSLLRPPGGDLKTYVVRQIGWPLIRWTKSLSDTGEGNYNDLAWRVEHKAEHGDIFLMHDVKPQTAQAIPVFLKALQERGFMFATVEELLYLNGVTPQPNVAYYDALGAKTYPKAGE